MRTIDAPTATVRPPTARPLDAEPAPWLAAPGGRPHAVSLISADPGLAARLSPADRERLRPHLRVAVHHRAPGPWEPPGTAHEGALGLLLLDGAMLRDISVAGRSCTELLGPGDLLRPFGDAATLPGSLPSESAWQVLTPACIALVDRKATAVLGRFPDLTAEIVDRCVARSRTVTVQLALSQVTGIDSRVEQLLWHLADRWGRVTADGVVVDVPLTHETIGRMVGARRPSVTSALSRLADDGRVVRRADGAWLLSAP